MLPRRTRARAVWWRYAARGWGQVRALRRRHGRQTRAYAPSPTVHEVWVRPGHHSTLTTAYRMFMSSWCSWMSRAAPARFRAAHGWWGSCAVLVLVPGLALA